MALKAKDSGSKDGTGEASVDTPSLLQELLDVVRDHVPNGPRRILLEDALAVCTAMKQDARTNRWSV